MRVLARLLYVLSTIDGEMSRLSVNNRLQTRADGIDSTQESAILALMEAALVGHVLETSGRSSATRNRCELTSILTHQDQAFASLTQERDRVRRTGGIHPVHLRPARRGRDELPAGDSIDTESARSARRRRNGLHRRDTPVRAKCRRPGARAGAGSRSVRSANQGHLRFIFRARSGIRRAGLDAMWRGIVAGWISALYCWRRTSLQQLQAAEGRIKGMRDKIEIERNRIADVRDVRDGTVYMMYATAKS